MEIWIVISRQPIEISRWTKNWLKLHDFPYIPKQFRLQIVAYFPRFFYTKYIKVSFMQ